MERTNNTRKYRPNDIGSPLALTSAASRRTMRVLKSQGSLAENKTREATSLPLVASSF
jgi:hypothetical protein